MLIEQQVCVIQETFPYTSHIKLCSDGKLKWPHYQPWNTRHRICVLVYWRMNASPSEVWFSIFLTKRERRKSVPRTALGRSSSHTVFLSSCLSHKHSPLGSQRNVSPTRVTCNRAHRSTQQKDKGMKLPHVPHTSEVRIRSKLKRVRRRVGHVIVLQ